MGEIDLGQNTEHRKDLVNTVIKLQVEQNLWIFF
jgi:hypothetical protein